MTSPPPTARISSACSGLDLDAVVHGIGVELGALLLAETGDDRAAFRGQAEPAAQGPEVDGVGHAGATLFWSRRRVRFSLSVFSSSSRRELRSRCWLIRAIMSSLSCFSPCSRASLPAFCVLQARPGGPASDCSSAWTLCSCAKPHADGADLHDLVVHQRDDQAVVAEQLVHAVDVEEELHVAQLAHLVQDAQDAPHLVLRLRMRARSAASSFCLASICAWASSMSRLMLVQLDDRRFRLEFQAVDVVQEDDLSCLLAWSLAGPPGSSPGSRAASPGWWRTAGAGRRPAGRVLLRIIFRGKCRSRRRRRPAAG